MDEERRHAELSDFACFAYPCWEIVADVDAWRERWHALGGVLTAGRMIARKDAPLWSQLGGNPAIAAVRREECISLGVIGADCDIKGHDWQQSRAEARAAAAPFTTEFLQQISDDLGVAIEEGKKKLRNDHTLSPSVRKLLGLDD